MPTVSTADDHYSGCRVVPSTIPTCEAIIKQLKLDASIRTDLQEYFEHEDHKFWYRRLIQDSLLTNERAFAIAIAMHVDSGLQFNEDTCTTIS